jgi:GTP:adenosylcobinamide-phosphate guanylyltransferase
MSEPGGLVLIPAHGLGTRLRDVTGGRAKTLVEVAGQPVLARLLRAVAGSGRHAVVSARPGDADVPACVAACGGCVEVRRREPRGYLRDVMDLSRGLSEELTVLDCDLVAPHAELTGFLAGAPRDTTVSMLFGVSAMPPSADPRSIRVIVDGGRMGLAEPATSSVPRAVGAYHWRHPAVAAARQFLASEGGSFHQFICHLAARRPPARLVGLSAAVNLNTPADLELAEEFVRQWREHELD